MPGAPPRWGNCPALCRRTATRSCQAQMNGRSVPVAERAGSGHRLPARLQAARLHLHGEAYMPGICLTRLFTQSLLHELTQAVLLGARSAEFGVGGLRPAYDTAVSGTVSAYPVRCGSLVPPIEQGRQTVRSQNRTWLGVSVHYACANTLKPATGLLGADLLQRTGRAGPRATQPDWQPPAAAVETVADADRWASSFVGQRLPARPHASSPVGSLARRWHCMELPCLQAAQYALQDKLTPCSHALTGPGLLRRHRERALLCGPV